MLAKSSIFTFAVRANVHVFRSSTSNQSNFHWLKSRELLKNLFPNTDYIKSISTGYQTITMINCISMISSSTTMMITMMMVFGLLIIINPIVHAERALNTSQQSVDVASTVRNVPSDLKPFIKSPVLFSTLNETMFTGNDTDSYIQDLFRRMSKKGSVRVLLSICIYR